MVDKAQDGFGTPEAWCSLITVTYNSREALKAFWGEAGRPPAGVEWLVVDNCSTDDSASVARDLGATVIELETNRGFSFANNVGLERSSGEFIGFVNPDIQIRYEDLPRLAEVAEAEGAIVGPQLMNSDGTRQPNGRGYPFLIDKVRNRLGREKELIGRYLLFAESDQPRPVCWLMGAAIFGRRADIEKFGGWDSRFFLYYEDKDICLRAWVKGVRVVLEPNVGWLHGWARETNGGFKLAPWRREIASMVKFYARYPEFIAPRQLSSRKHPAIQDQVYGSAS